MPKSINSAMPITVDELIEALQKIKADKNFGGDCLVSTEPDESAYDNAVFVYSRDPKVMHYAIQWGD